MVMEVVGQEAVGFSFSRISCFLTILFPSDANRYFGRYSDEGQEYRPKNIDQ